ncbi:MAG: S-methyl-5'-thioadenosine phosphorylase [Deltaproteobacteria bacterium]|nr:S-methyl-5'-thioadenosine phosphorylase [Deltaproteobacteria bacterium]
MIGIIGGSGLYQMQELKNTEELKVNTPFGEPSDALILGELSGVKVAFLARHGRGHRILPSELNFRANIAALKIIGCQSIISISAVGSLKVEIEPGHLVIIDQFIDRTFARPATFFGNGIVAHVGFAHPICANLQKQLVQSGHTIGATVHDGGTYLCVEGPMFSTQAESQLYRQWGAAVIGMTNLQEAKLAREAQMCYATVALSTDYDCWHEGHDTVTIEMIIDTLNKNIATAQSLLKTVLPKINQGAPCKCRESLKNAIITDKTKIPPATLERLRFMLPKEFLEG